MESTYENVYIGTFIFTLGYVFSANNNGAKSSVAIELYQQTGNGEKVIGDLLTSIGGKGIIVEFKRNRPAVAAELRKMSKAPLRRALSSGSDNRFVDVSKRCHYIAYARKHPSQDGQCIAFVSYHDIITGAPDARAYIDTDFCKRYVSHESYECGVSSADFDYYIAELSGMAGGTCGGLAVSIGEDGLRSAIKFDDVRELNKSLALAEQIELRKERTLELSLDGPDLGI